MDDSKTAMSYRLHELSFSTVFPVQMSSSGRPGLFGDEMAIFAASDTTTYQGFEFGIRDSLETSEVYAYTQFPLARGGVDFHEQLLFANDGRVHSYVLLLAGPIVLVFADGVLLGHALFPVAPPSTFRVVATAHRASGGWDSSGLALAVLSLSAAIQE